jgi:sulfofructose kinase
MTKVPSIICVGGVVLDRIFYVDALPQGSSKRVATDYAERGGGMAATAAAAIAALGARSALWARIGDDPTGRTTLAELERAGIDVSRIRICAGGRTATSTVHIERTGERALTNFRGHLPDDTEHLNAADLAHADAILGDVRWPTGSLWAFEQARAIGIPTVLDADAGSVEALPHLVALAAHTIFSQQGLTELTGETSPEAGLAVASRLAASDAILGVTCGENGSLWWVDGQTLAVPAFRVAAVNTNGVGDVFHGAYALAIAEARTPVDAAQFASAAAACKCTDPRGWEGMPTRTQCEALLIASRDRQKASHAQCSSLAP